MCVPPISSLHSKSMIKIVDWTSIYRNYFIVFLHLSFYFSIVKMNRFVYTQLSGPGNVSVIIWFRLFVWWFRFISLLIELFVAVSAAELRRNVPIPPLFGNNWLAIELLLKFNRSEWLTTLASEPKSPPNSLLNFVPLAACRKSNKCFDCIWWFVDDDDGAFVNVW